MAETRQPRGPRRGPGSHRGGPAMEKAKDFKGTIKKLLSYVGRYKWGLLIVMLLAMAATVFMVVGPKILGHATTKIFEGIGAKIAGTGGIDFSYVWKIILTLIILYLLSALFQFIQGWVMADISNKTTYRMRKELDAKIHKLPLAFYDGTTHGEVLSRITNDVDTINHSLSQSVTQIITSVTQVLGFTIMMFTISWQLALITLITIPSSFLIIAGIFRVSQKYFRGQQNELGHVNGQVEETFTAHTIIRSFNAQKISFDKFQEHNDKLYKSAWKANFLSGVMMPIINFIGNISYVVVCVVGGYYVGLGWMNLGDIQAFIQYVRQFNQPIASIGNISNILQSLAAAAERVFEFLAEEEQKEDDDCIVLDESKIVPNVEFKDVSFGYKPNKIVLSDLSFKAKNGQKIAIVGKTGAGKTTIAKLLMRFYDVNSGVIDVSGIPINKIRREDLHELFANVSQDTWLFQGSIAENIHYGKLSASDKDVLKAAHDAQLDYFVHSLPNGYDMQITEDAENLSQGQRQLITIARAILSNPKLLILDEATSSVDTRTEMALQSAMDILMKGRTTFVIAHRLSTIVNADLILVLEKGDIIEQGTHNDLLAKGGAYAKMYNSQFDD